MDRDGSNPTRITDLAGNETRPSITSDGTQIVFQRSGEDGRSSIWKISANGGEATKLSPDGASKPALSPDGKTFAFEIGAEGAEKIATVPIDSAEGVKEFNFVDIAVSSIFEWSADGRSINYVNRQAGQFEIWSQPMNDSKPIQIFASHGDRIYAFDVSRNGKGMVFSRGTETSDVVMIGGIR
jgi:Tol biopolymer transport system component